MKPYPWLTRKYFTAQRQVGHTLSRLVWPLTLIALLLNPISLLPRFWATRRFHTKNDTWSRRGLVLIVFGLLLIPVLGAWPIPLGLSAYDVLYSLGDKPDRLPVEEAVRTYLTYGLPWSLVLVGLAAICHSYFYEYSAQRFLAPTAVTLGMRMRRMRNTRRLAAGAGAGDGFVKFGVIADDVIPWRTIRYGRIVQRPVKELGHGCITGSNGTGKTILAGNLAYWMAVNGAAVINPDCKASLKTLRAMKAVAEAAGVSFTSFDVGLNSGERSWYDPLGWDGSPSEKTSMLIESFHFPESGGASYYKNAAEAWLTLQFEIMDHIGLRKGESRFDFLHDTATPAGLGDRIRAWREGSEYQRAKYTEWSKQIKPVKGDDLTNLRNNLARVINAAGDRLRPSPDGAPPISFARAAEEGGVIYIGLSPATNAIALKTIGSLVIRDLTVLSGLRATGRASTKRPILALVDEASRLGDRATVMEDLFATARESEIWVWPITQSFATWPATTHKEMVMNALTQSAFRLQDNDTAMELTESLGTIPALTEMSEQRIDHHAFRAETVSSDGGGRVQLETAPHLRADRLLSVENHYAYVWFSGSWVRATKERWRSRRVKNDVIKRDAPLVHVVPVNIVLPDDDTIEPSMDLHRESFDSLTAGFGHDTVEGEVLLEVPRRDPAPQGDWDEDAYALDDDAAQPMTAEQRAFIQQQAPARAVTANEQAAAHQVPSSDTPPVAPDAPEPAKQTPKKQARGGSFRTPSRMIDAEPGARPVESQAAVEQPWEETPFTWGAGEPSEWDDPGGAASPDTAVEAVDSQTSPTEPTMSEEPEEAPQDEQVGQEAPVAQEPAPEPVVEHPMTDTNIEPAEEQQPADSAIETATAAPEPVAQQEPHPAFAPPTFNSIAPPATPQDAFPAPEQPSTEVTGVWDDEFDDPDETPVSPAAPAAPAARPAPVEFEPQHREEPAQEESGRSGIFGYEDDDDYGPGNREG